MIKAGRMQVDVEPIELLNHLHEECQIRGMPYLHVIKDSATNVQFSCPFHSGGIEKHPSCGISKHDVTRNGYTFPEGTVHCFTCGYSANTAKFIGDLFNMPRPERAGRAWLRDRYVSVEEEERQSFTLPQRGATKKEVSTIYVPEEVLDSYRYYHDYMYKRNLNDWAIEKFDIGYDAETDCITMPIRDDTGQTVFVQRRAVTSKFHNYGANDPKSDYLWGEYDFRNENTQCPVYVTESILNAIMIWQLGRPAVALMGVGTTNQYKLLRNLPTRELILALDPDKAGQKASSKIREAVGRDKLVSFLKYPKEFYENKWDINDKPELLDLDNKYF